MTYSKSVPETMTVHARWEIEHTYPVVSNSAMPLSCGLNFRRSKQSKPKRSANTSLYVAHRSAFATSCQNCGEAREFAFAKLEKFLITAKEKAEKILPRLDFFAKNMCRTRKKHTASPCYFAGIAGMGSRRIERMRTSFTGRSLLSVWLRCMRSMVSKPSITWPKTV